MFNTLLQRQCPTGLNRFFPTILKLSCSDSAVVNREPKLKALVEEDFSRVDKKEFKGHFIESLFLNKLQPKVLEYPELDTKEEVAIIRQHQGIAQKLLTGKTDNETAPSEVDSKTAVSTLKKHELIGFKVSRLKRGFGYLSSEFTFMQEVLALDPSLSKTVCEQEDFGIYLIDKFGSDLQKQEYLLKLTSGEKIVCFANIEKEIVVSSLMNSFNTSAIPSSDTESYTISGTKCWVYNANSADLFILSANVLSGDGKEPKPTLFLVDRNTPGVKVHEPIETVGLKNLSICDVTFDNVVVPKSSVLGDVCQGDTIIKNVLSQGKLNNGGHCLAAMRKLLSAVVQHCIYNDFFKKDKHELEYFRIKVGNLTSRMYVVESMTYLMTGRLDSHKDADVFLESLIVKIFASETLQFFVKEALEILGPEFFSNDDNLIKLSRDSQFYAACDDANAYLREILSHTGINFTMQYQKQRNFLQAMSDVFSNLDLSMVVHKDDKLSFKHIAYGYLHHIFEAESKLFEDAIAKLHESTQFLINKYKGNVFDRKIELRYLADMVVNVYAMAATLGRASRAYCIGVKLQEIDRICAEAEVRRSSLRVREMNRLIQDHDKLPHFTEIATSVMNGSKYTDVYPVLKNVTVR